MKTIKGTHFFGNKISAYGIEHNRVDYSTLAKSFDCILNNNIMQTIGLEYFESVNGSEEYFINPDGDICTYDELEELEEKITEELDTLNSKDIYSLSDEESEKISELEAELDEVRDCMNNPRYEDIYQYYIISDSGLEILQEYTNEIVFRSEEHDLNIWCVTHYGTSWTHVLTNIRIETE